MNRYHNRAPLDNYEASAAGARTSDLEDLEERVSLLESELYQDELCSPLGSQAGLMKEHVNSPVHKEKRFVADKGVKRVVVSIHKEGPLRVHLKRFLEHEEGNFTLRIAAFSKGPAGERGPVEESRKVRPGDKLIALNEESTEEWTMDVLVHKLGVAHYPLRLIFEKAEKDY
ncbi:MAG: hypothetical protein AAGM67_17420, partial [Bacteroidota bacterium]